MLWPIQSHEKGGSRIIQTRHPLNMETYSPSIQWSTPHPVSWTWVPQSTMKYQSTTRNNSRKRGRIWSWRDCRLEKEPRGENSLQSKVEGIQSTWNDLGTPHQPWKCKGGSTRLPHEIPQQTLTACTTKTRNPHDPLSQRTIQTYTRTTHRVHSHWYTLREHAGQVCTKRSSCPKRGVMLWNNHFLTTPIYIMDHWPDHFPTISIIHTSSITLTIYSTNLWQTSLCPQYTCYFTYAPTFQTFRTLLQPSVHFRTIP